MPHRTALLLVATFLIGTPTMSSIVSAETMVFEGLIEASERGILSSQLDGVIAEVRFDGGEPVETGQVLIKLDPRDAQLSVMVAEANLARALAERGSAQRSAERQEELLSRGVAADATVVAVRTALAVAQADVQVAEANLERAKLDLMRTEIRSPVSGFVSPAQVAVGTFVEAESGAPLGEVVSLDPAIVAYQAPYADRLATLEASGADNVDALLSAIRISLVLPGGRPYSEIATPHLAEASVNPQTGTITIRARIPNPNLILRPGMPVTVHSELVK
jgi:RND family efflux transporter MFP subunit